MTTPFFDTHGQYKALVQSGFTDAQAEAIVDIIVEVLVLRRAGSLASRDPTETRG